MNGIAPPEPCTYGGASYLFSSAFCSVVRLPPGVLRATRTALLAASQRDLLTATQVLGRSFQGSIDEIATDTSLLARLPASSVLANAPAGARSERDKQLVADVFASMLAVHPEYYQIRLIDADHHGLELIRVDRDGDKLSRVPEVDLQEKAHYPYVFNTLLLSAGQCNAATDVASHFSDLLAIDVEQFRRVIFAGRRNSLHIGSNSDRRRYSTSDK